MSRCYTASSIQVNKFDFVLVFLQFTQCLLVAINKPHRYNSTSIFDHRILSEVHRFSIALRLGLEKVFVSFGIIALLEHPRMSQFQPFSD